uniref:Uncharacterized protein n=1 Tax=Erwinia amylovora TaxID=552 RepID=A0A0P0ZGS6_ERWAM|nr:hypothetical protein EAMY692_p10029 [Erwinia amylovora]
MMFPSAIFMINPHSFVDCRAAFERGFRHVEAGETLPFSFPLFLFSLLIA